MCGHCQGLVGFRRSGNCSQQHHLGLRPSRGPPPRRQRQRGPPVWPLAWHGERPVGHPPQQNHQYSSSNSRQCGGATFGATQDRQEDRDRLWVHQDDHHRIYHRQGRPMIVAPVTARGTTTDGLRFGTRCSRQCRSSSGSSSSSSSNSSSSSGNAASSRRRAARPQRHRRHRRHRRRQRHLDHGQRSTEQRQRQRKGEQPQPPPLTRPQNHGG